MRSYVRESRSIGENTRIITHYTLTEHLFLSIIKLIFFIAVLWPAQILWFIIWNIIKLPFVGIAKFYKSTLSPKTKIIVTLIVVGLLLLGSFIISVGNGN